MKREEFMQNNKLKELAIAGLNREKELLTGVLGKYRHDSSEGIAVSSRLGDIDYQINNLIGLNENT